VPVLASWFFSCIVLLVERLDALYVWLFWLFVVVFCCDFGRLLLLGVCLARERLCFVFRVGMLLVLCLCLLFLWVCFLCVLVVGVFGVF
jgi:hypothetical protein